MSSPRTLFALLSLSCAAVTFAAEPYRVDKALHIGGEGGWDYLTVDAEHQLLYVPRTTHTQVVDAASGKVVADIPGQQRNHGVALVPAVGRGFITDGKAASVTIFDLKTNKVLGSVKAADDADAIRYDESSDELYISCGDASALVCLSPKVDPKSGNPDAIIDLGGKPEALTCDGHGHVFVNLQDKDVVAVVDTKSRKVIGRWPVVPGGSPVGISIDPEHGRLFVGCRKPQTLVVMSTNDGKVLGDVPIGAGVDATVYDEGYALASCRDGTLAVVAAGADGHFALVQTVTTAPGARTMGLDPTAHTLYLPTAEFLPLTGNQRPTPKPNSFEIIKARLSNR